MVGGVETEYVGFRKILRLLFLGNFQFVYMGEVWGRGERWVRIEFQNLIPVKTPSLLLQKRLILFAIEDTFYC